MERQLSRRRLLSATAGSGLAIATAGCLDRFETDPAGSASMGDSGTDEDGPMDGPEPSGIDAANGCEAGESFLDALFAADYETAADHYPHEYLEDYERADFVDQLASRGSDDGLEVLVDSCREPREPADELVAAATELLQESVTTIEWRRYDVEATTDDGTVSRSIDVLVGEIEDRWYAGLVDEEAYAGDESSDTEVTVELAADDQLIEADADGAAAEVLVSVIDENGDPVADATVLAAADSARLDGVVSATTGETDGLEGEYDLADNQAVLALDGAQGLHPDQDIGTLDTEVIPPSDSNYIDEHPNPQIRVVRN